MIKTENFKQIEITSPDQLRQWLQKNGQQTESVWLVTYKKESRDTYVSTSEVLDELLCFGWIDGIRRKLDVRRTMQLISPRKTQHWTKSYKDRAAKLIAAGRMEPAGYASIASAKSCGLWDFMDEVDRLIIPDDLRAGLESLPGATEFFTSINPSSMRFALRWLKLTKTPQTRSRRIEKLAALASKKEKLPGS